MKDLIEMDFGAKNWLVEGDYTDVRKAEKLEGFGLPLRSPLSILGRKWSVRISAANGLANVSCGPAVASSGVTH